MFAGVVAFFIAGQMVDVDVLGGAPDLASCKQYAQKAVEQGQPQFGKDVEIVVKCFPAEQLKTLDKAAFMAAPIAAAGFGTGK